MAAILLSLYIMSIRPTGLTLVEIFFWIVPMAARLINLISIKTKEYLIWPPLWKRVYTLHNLYKGSVLLNDLLSHRLRQIYTYKKWLILVDNNVLFFLIAKLIVITD